MEKYFSQADFGCKNCKREEFQIPNCINDDFCIMSPLPKNNGVLAMAFVDMQPIDSVYPQTAAFCKGTLFPNLDMPFYGGFEK